MDEETAHKIAAYCLKSVEDNIDKDQQIADKIATQLIIVYRIGVVEGRRRANQLLETDTHPDTSQLSIIRDKYETLA